MVGEATVLVESEQEEGRVPVGRRAESFVYFLDEGFSVGDGGRRVEGLHGAAFGVDVGELRQGASGSIGIELGKRLDVRGVLATGNGPFVVESVGLEASRVRVVDPADACF